MSIYDPIILGPLTLKPGMITADAVSVELMNTDPESQDQPYGELGSQVNVPVAVWEQAQEAAK